MRQLAEIRRKKRVPQVALARRLFLGSQTISQRETGQIVPPLDEADRQARELGYRLVLIPLEGTNEPDQ
jgi:transcriptional regulator with XRE-family HTH domain